MNLSKSAPDLIREAAKSPLGLLALTIFLVSSVALAFFTTASELIKVVIFVLIFVGAGLFVVSVLHLAALQGQEPTPEPTPKPTPEPTPVPGTGPTPPPPPLPERKPPPGIQKPTIPFDWVTIPEGNFWMGSDIEQDADARGFDNEKRHSVYLPEYHIAKVPVTVDQFRRFISSTGYKTTAERQGGARDLAKGLERDDWPRKKDAYWEHPHGCDSYTHDEHPVTCISWYDAVAFCEWAGVRLPTEAEWEKAAGWDPEVQVKHIYPWGDEPPDKNRCNFDMQVGDTTPVDRYKDGASRYGVLDMAGNVWEWTSSLYKEYPYKADDRENPEATGERVLRGGSFYQGSKYVRCAYRNRHRPDAKVSDYGFRVCAVKLGE